MESSHSPDSSDFDALREKASSPLAQQSHSEQATTDRLEEAEQRVQGNQAKVALQQQETLTLKKELEAFRHWAACYYELAPVAYFTLDQEGRIVTCNRLGCQLLDYEQPFLEEKDLASFVHKEDHPLFFEFLSQLATGANHRTCLVRIQTRQGHWLQLRLAGSGVEKTREGVYLLAATDLTPQMEAVGQGQATETLYKQAEVVGQLGSYEVDVHSFRFCFSDNLYRLLGYEPQSFEPTLDWLDSISHPEDVFVVRKVIEQAIADRQPYQYVRRVYKLNGETRYLSSRGKVISNNEGKAVKLIGIVQDVTEWKHAEQQQQQAAAEIEQQANFIRQVTDAVPGTISIFDIEQQKVVYINRNHLTRLGYSAQEREQMSHLRWMDQVLHPQDKAAMQQHIAEMSWTQDDGVRCLDYRIRNKAGEWEWRRTRAKVFKRDDAGKPLQYISLAEDITEQKRNHLKVQQQASELAAANEELTAANEAIKTSHEQLTRTKEALLQLTTQLEERVVRRTFALQLAQKEAQQQRERLYALFMQAPGAICILEGKELVFELVNPRFGQLFPERTLLGRPVGEAFSESMHEPILQLLQNVYCTGEAFEGKEMPLAVARKEQGPPEDRYFHFINQARRNAQGEVDGVIVFAYEVTDQVLARKKVEESEARLQGMLDALPHIAWTFPPEGTTITFFNRHWQEFTGLTPHESSGTGWFKALHPEDAAAIAAFRAHRRPLGEAPPVEHRYRRRDGQYRWHLIRVVPVRNAHGKIMLWLGTATDIHEQKQVQLQLEQTLHVLEQRNHELDQFVYKTSHDLRSPLSTILGLVDLLKQEEDQDAKAQYVDLIENRVHKLDRFILSMLDYSRNTRTVTRVGKIDFKELVSECVKGLEYMKHFSRLQVLLEIGEGAFGSDVFRLKIIFTNLIANAVKYQDFNKSESRLLIRVGITDKEALLDFIDNGVGIEAAFQDKIFDMFFRATEQSDGSGLGLYIVKQAVGVLNGRIEFESQVGVGTCFRICLPSLLGSKARELS